MLHNSFAAAFYEDGVFGVIEQHTEDRKFRHVFVDTWLNFFVSGSFAEEIKKEKSKEKVKISLNFT